MCASSQALRSGWADLQSSIQQCGGQLTGIAKLRIDFKEDKIRFDIGHVDGQAVDLCDFLSQ